LQLRHARAFSVRKACGRRRGRGNGFDGRAGDASSNLTYVLVKDVSLSVTCVEEDEEDDKRLLLKPKTPETVQI